MSQLLGEEKRDGTFRVSTLGGDNDDDDDDDDHSWIDQWWSRIDSVGGGKMGSGWVTSIHLTICRVLRGLGCNVFFFTFVFCI